MASRLMVATSLASVVLLFGTFLAAQPAAPADDVQDIVFLADGGPVLIRLHLRTDGQPFRQAYREAWRDYVTHLFKQLDHDGDGFLSEQEAALLPPAQPVTSSGPDSAIKVNTAFNFRVVDVDGDGKVSLAELLEYYRQYGGDALQTRFSVPAPDFRPEVERALFARLDKDHDGKLSRAELRAAAESLFELDRDGDELLSPQELASLPNLARSDEGLRPTRRTGPRPTPRSPFILPLPEDDRARLAARIREWYGSAEEARNAEQVLDRQPDVELVIQLGTVPAGQKPIEIVRPQGAAAAQRVQTTAEGTIVLTFGKTLIELRRNESRPRMVEGARQRTLQLFRAADVTGKGHLTAQDAEAAGFFPGQFALLDRNGDGKLTEIELLKYLDEVQPRQARAATSGVALLISDEGRGLFDLLDRNRDGRLSLREVRAAPQLLELLGREQEGTLTADNLPRTFRLAVGLCDASFDRFAGRGTFSPRGMPLLTLDWSKPGMAWFHKMDRNHDGDVSRREFLGSREAFDRLDTDGDGLISLEEAERAVQKPPVNTDENGSKTKGKRVVPGAAARSVFRWF